MSLALLTNPSMVNARSLDVRTCSTTNMCGSIAHPVSKSIYALGGRGRAFMGGSALASTCAHHNNHKHMMTTAMSQKKDDAPTPKSDHDKGEYVRAIVENVGRTSGHAPVIFLKMLDGSDLMLPVFIGEAECSALLKEIRNQQTLRPMTHDLMKSSLELLNFKVSKINVTDMRDNTFFARIYFANQDGEEVDSIDARPSDAINLAVRFGAPIYVSKHVVKSSAYLIHGGAMAGPDGGVVTASGEDNVVSDEMFTKIQQQALRRKDPALELRSRLALAVAEERYDEAAQIKDHIAAVIGSDHTASLLYQMEQAVADERYDDAAQIRDELQALDKEEEMRKKIVFELEE